MDNQFNQAYIVSVLENPELTQKEKAQKVLDDTIQYYSDKSKLSFDNSTRRCAYRTKGVKACAVGRILSDSDADHFDALTNMDSNDVYDNILEEYTGHLMLELPEVFWYNLQAYHDCTALFTGGIEAGQALERLNKIIDSL